MRNPSPVITFTFDDFPRSAAHVGARILSEHGFRGTFYTSFGLMGRKAPTGDIFIREDLEALLADKHELGCHTFAHFDSWEAAPSVFEDSVLKNSQALHEFLPNVRFETLSYPLSCPRPSTKRRVARYFLACRGGGQKGNVRTVDLNNVQAFFIEKSRNDLNRIKDIIAENATSCGWLVLATHDIDNHPTPFGCLPEEFRTIVSHAANSGAQVLPMAEATRLVTGQNASKFDSEAIGTLANSLTRQSDSANR